MPHKKLKGELPCGTSPPRPPILEDPVRLPDRSSATPELIGPRRLPRVSLRTSVTAVVAKVSLLPSASFRFPGHRAGLVADPLDGRLPLLLLEDVSSVAEDYGTGAPRVNGNILVEILCCVWESGKTESRFGRSPSYSRRLGTGGGFRSPPSTLRWCQ